ncbi:MAG: non-lysosomal glucosylceramidase [Bacteroidales bacterium]|nr:non-lysosomal glucosylceramidase [Bacteroidales bacterium]
MKKITAILASLALCAALDAQPWQPMPWPVLTSYDSAHLQRVALPLGGIGTGTVSLGGRGELRDWEIMNVPGKGFSTIRDGNDAPFFAIYTRTASEGEKTRLLTGPLYPQEYLNCEGQPVNHHGLPRFRHASFDAAYPFGQVNLSDDAMPVKVRVKGFNPLVPGDTEASSLPLAVLSYEVTNTAGEPVEVSVCGSIRNFVGRDGRENDTNGYGYNNPTGAADNRNEYRENPSAGLKGLYFYSEGVDEKHPAWGNFSLVTDSDQAVSYRTFSVDNSWANSILNFWDDLSDDGVISNPVANVRHSVGNDQDPMGSLAVKSTLAPGESKVFNFYLVWNFPNRIAWAWNNKIVGNFYSRQYPDSWDAASRIVPFMDAYEGRTLAFVNALLSSSYPGSIKEAALYNLNVLRSQTVFRIADGHMMGWEGVMDRFGACMGSCTHVWNYETATAFLFPELARTMRDVEFNISLHDDGAMAFRTELPLDSDQNRSTAADGQLGCIMKLYREWQLCGSSDYLASYWEQCKRALSYAWTEGGWDANEDGIMEGSQHNTMDVNYFGPNSQMTFWYMGALRAAEQMALAMKDKAFARKCHAIFEKASAYADGVLFNGEYYEHKITDPETFEFLPEDSDRIPPFQLGKACLVDQLVGQYMAHICGLGYLASKDNIRTTMQSILKYNYHENLYGHFNNMRTYLFEDEAGMLMAAWPKGRLEVPFPYFNESMTGFEYTAATGMIYEGMVDEGVRCVSSIRARFDGAKRNPFSEPECGHHYARSMASWSTVLAYSDFHYSGVDRTMSITGKPGTWFWSVGTAWGTVTNENGKTTLEVIEGGLELGSFRSGDRVWKKKISLSAGESFSF